MEEYILRELSLVDWQKLLNQWRHEYILEILQMKVIHDKDNTTVVILCKRTKR